MYPHERSLVEEMQDKQFVLLGVNSDKLDRAKKAVAENKLNWRSFHAGEQGTHVLGLDDEHEGVGELGRVGVVEHAHAVLLGELGRPVSAALGDDQLVHRAPRAQQSRQQGLAHDASTEDRNRSHER